MELSLNAIIFIITFKFNIALSIDYGPLISDFLYIQCLLNIFEFLHILSIIKNPTIKLKKQYRYYGL